MTIREEIAERLYSIGSADRDDFINEYRLDIRKSRSWEELTVSSKQFWIERTDQILSIKGIYTQKEVDEAEQRGIRKVVEATRSTLEQIDSLVGDIEGDWTDPRYECGKISKLIGEWQREWQAFLKGVEK